MPFANNPTRNLKTRCTVLSYIVVSQSFSIIQLLAREYGSYSLMFYEDLHVFVYLNTKRNDVRTHGRGPRSLDNLYTVCGAMGIRHRHAGCSSRKDWATLSMHGDLCFPELVLRLHTLHAEVWHRHGECGIDSLVSEHSAVADIQWLPIFNTLGCLLRISWYLSIYDYSAYDSIYLCMHRQETTYGMHPPPHMACIHLLT